MYELFYAEPTAAMGTRVILEEIGVQYRLIDTDITDHSSSIPPPFWSFTCALCI